MNPKAMRCRKRRLQFVMVILVLSWWFLRGSGYSAASGRIVLSSQLQELNGELVASRITPEEKNITQTLKLRDGHDYVVEFEAAASNKAHIVAGIVRGESRFMLWAWLPHYLRYAYQPRQNSFDASAVHYRSAAKSKREFRP